MSDQQYLIQALDRYQLLMDGKKLPETLEEDVFLAAYQDGLMGINLLERYLSFCDNPSIMSIELHAALMGYSLGQAQSDYIIDQDGQQH